MAIKHYEVRYGNGFQRMLQIDGTLGTGKILYLRKPTEDRCGPDDFYKYVIQRERLEYREVSPGVLAEVSILDLAPFVEEKPDDADRKKYIVHG